MTPRKTSPLRNALMGGKTTKDLSPQEVDMSGNISPVANIKVIGIGGGGGNAINRMIDADLEGVDFIAINTDTQALFTSNAQTRLTIGEQTTRGLGAGADPEVGKTAAVESEGMIKDAIGNADMVFLTAGLGGGSGSGGAPEIARMAKEAGALVVAVVTKPFSFEGPKRSIQAIEAYEKLKEEVDTLITIPNDRILNLIDKKTSLMDSFRIVDDVLYQGIKGVSDLITQTGLINVDFADVKAIMNSAGSALMGIGYGAGESRAADAARAAINSPLLEESIHGASGIIFTISSGSDLSMYEVDEAARIITESCSPDANVIFGTSIDEDLDGEVHITVIATGFEQAGAVARPGTRTSSIQAVSGNQSSFGTTSLNAEKPKASQTASSEDLDVPAFLRNKQK